MRIRFSVRSLIPILHAEALGLYEFARLSNLNARSYSLIDDGLQSAYLGFVSGA